jgi:phosphohistidine phosphatase SixA
MNQKRILAIACACAVILSATAASADDQVIFVVRHAERADAGKKAAKSMSADPALSSQGQSRAKRLSSMLRSAKVTQIFTTEFRRTHQTVAPLADRVHVKPVSIPSNDVDALVNRLEQASGTTLVVGHTNTIPEILKKLGVTQDVTIAEDEFDNLFVVVRAASGRATLVRLKY